MTRKRNKVALSKKQNIVADISEKVAGGLATVPEACSAHGIKEYTYYNWKKRVDQLAARKKVQITPPKPFILRKAVQQLPAGASSVDTPIFAGIDLNNLTLGQLKKLKEDLNNVFQASL